MDIDFIDIKIISLEEEMTVESPVRPGLLYVYLRLTQTPPPMWQNYFKESRKVSRHPHWRHAWIDRKYIIVECLTEELEKYHLNDLRQDIAHANRCYREFVLQQSRTDVQKEELQIQEREKLREMKSRLSFD